MVYIFLSIIGFFLGSVMFGKVIFSAFRDENLIEKSKNHLPDASEIFLLHDTLAGCFATLFDILKGFVPVFLCMTIAPHNNVGVTIVMVAPLLGHAFSPWNRKQSHKYYNGLLGLGGRGINVSIGCLLGLIPYYYNLLILLISLFALSVLIVIPRKNERVIWSYSIFQVCSLILTKNIFVVIGCIIIGALVIIKQEYYRNSARNLAESPKKTTEKSKNNIFKSIASFTINRQKNKKSAVN